jgi:hypothetical protein
MSDTPVQAVALFEFTVEARPQLFEFESSATFEQKMKSAASIATITQGSQPRVAFGNPSNAWIAIAGSPNVIETTARVRIADNGTVEFLENGQVTDTIPFDRIQKMNPENLGKLLQRIRVAMIHPKMLALLEGDK